MKFPEKLEANNEAPTQLDSSEGVLKATFAYALFDHGMRMEHDPHLIWLAKEPRVRLNIFEGAKRRLKDGDKVRIKANGQEISAAIKLDKGVANGTAVLPLGFAKVPVHELGTHLWNGLVIEIPGANQ